MASLKEIIEKNKLPVRVTTNPRDGGPDFTIVSYDSEKGECKVKYFHWGQRTRV